MRVSKLDRIVSIVALASSSRALACAASACACSSGCDKSMTGLYLLPSGT